MNDDQMPFIRAIQADPFNDVPRMVYADWLDDRACEMTPRAEFIRKSCRGAELQRKYNPVVDDIPHHDPTTCPDCIANRENQEIGRWCHFTLISYGEEWAFNEIVRPCQMDVGGPERWLDAKGISNTSEPPRESTSLRSPYREWEPRIRPIWKWEWNRGFISKFEGPYGEVVPRLKYLLTYHPIQSIIIDEQNWIFFKPQLDKKQQPTGIWFTEWHHSDNPNRRRSLIRLVDARAFPAREVMIEEIQILVVQHWRIPNPSATYGRPRLQDVWNNMQSIGAIPNQANWLQPFSLAPTTEPLVDNPERDFALDAMRYAMQANYHATHSPPFLIPIDWDMPAVPPVIEIDRRTEPTPDAPKIIPDAD